MTVGYKLFNAEAEAQEQSDALNAEASQGVRFIVERAIGGHGWIIVKQLKCKTWAFAGYLQEAGYRWVNGSKSEASTLPLRATKSPSRGARAKLIPAA
jgi:hypothetical protein